MNVIFGIPDVLPIVNLVILCGKHFVHTRKMKGQDRCFIVFKSYLRHEYETEKYVARIAKKERECDVKWGPFCDVFQEN